MAKHVSSTAYCLEGHSATPHQPQCTQVGSLRERERERERERVGKSVIYKPSLYHTFAALHVDCVHTHHTIPYPHPFIEFTTNYPCLQESVHNFISQSMVTLKHGCQVRTQPMTVCASNHWTTNWRMNTQEIANSKQNEDYTATVMLFTWHCTEAIVLTVQHKSGHPHNVCVVHVCRGVPLKQASEQFGCTFCSFLEHNIIIMLNRFTDSEILYIFYSRFTFTFFTHPHKKY